MPRYRNAKLSEITDGQRLIFDQFVELLEPYSKWLDNRIKTKEHYELWTNHSFRSQSMHPKTKRGILFAGLVILKNRVGFYFYPLHINDALRTRIDASILSFWKGGSAFHFLEPLSVLSSEKFQELLLEGLRYYQQNWWVPNDKFPTYDDH